MQVVRRLLAQHVPPAAVQEAVQDVRGDDVREGERLLRLEGGLQSQRGAGQHGAPVGAGVWGRGLGPGTGGRGPLRVTGKGKGTCF